MTFVLTRAQYVAGHRNDAAYSIPTNPFFSSDCTRAEAIQNVVSGPVLRRSSITGYYALTFKTGETIQHSLLRLNPDNSVDNVSESGTIYERFCNICILLDRALSFMRYSEDKDPE